jgi:hypothetical protein
MQFPSFRRLALGALPILAAIGLFAIPASASAASLSPWGQTYYGSTASSFNNTWPSSSSYSNYYPSYSAYGSGYGSISQATGRPRTEYVNGYWNSHGSYTDPYYRS